MSQIHMLVAFDIIVNKLLTLVHIGFWNILSPTGPPYLCAMERGWTKAGRGKGYHCSIQGQLPEGDGQGSCHQDVWQTLDKSH